MGNEEFHLKAKVWVDTANRPQIEAWMEGSDFIQIVQLVKVPNLWSFEYEDYSSMPWTAIEREMTALFDVYLRKLKAGKVERNQTLEEAIEWVIGNNPAEDRRSVWEQKFNDPPGFGGDISPKE
jgi:hypothetical protein